MVEVNEKFLEIYQPIVDVLLDKQAMEVSVHDLSEVSGFTEAFIVAIARSDLHAKTLRDAAENFLDKTQTPYNIEGENSTKWCLVDAGHIVINILSKEGNNYYRLDSLWGDAPNKKFTDDDFVAETDLFK